MPVLDMNTDFLLRLLLQANRAMGAFQAFRHCHPASRRLFKQLNGCQDVLLVCFHNSAIHQHLIHDKVGLHRHTCPSIILRPESLAHLDALLRIILCILAEAQPLFKAERVWSHLLQAKHEIQLAHVAEVPVQCLHKAVDELQDGQLILQATPVMLACNQAATAAHREQRLQAGRLAAGGPKQAISKSSEGTGHKAAACLPLQHQCPRERTAMHIACRPPSCSGAL